MDISPAANTVPFLTDLQDDPQLVHVCDTDAGIVRRRAGRGFTYKRPDGSRVKDPEVLKRIRSLAIPPAWTDVWICPLANGHIQATGRDQRGRKQYRYHPDWTAFRDAVKFASLVDFAERLPALRARVDTDLSRPGLPREKVLAVVVRLLDKTLIRVGNDSYRRENRSFGLTTLRSQHVATSSSSVRFAFRGKSGREWKLKLVDRRIARIIATIEDLPGQHLFQYVDGKTRVPIHSHDVNDYIREAAGEEFTSKHFRTWAATSLATVLLADAECPSAKRRRTIAANRIIDRVAQELRNTRTVCRKGYIHPAVLDAWEAGTLGDEINELRRRYRKPLSGLDKEESLVLRWLRATIRPEG
ncbi:DNA topoisomerase IB [Roseibium salinum]|uniref:DNA topoisomerase n=1 Tax=Roseibium salinum TaxID=1604349 RepID=A0ABT3QX86_9HYPH|nr:DNA topoisomerase IB [Roseibium sp. DSM 29163]MCX2721549.1 DNA topoisomerase IB [Roseibium sp. DSM 29163]